MIDRDSMPGRKTGPKPGLKKRVWGPPGRGVLRFSVQAYRNPVHIFVFFAFFSKNGAI